MYSFATNKRFVFVLQEKMVKKQKHLKWPFIERGYSFL